MNAYVLGVEVESHKVYDADRTRTVVDSLTVDGRRWVVIDPEDRAAVERLTRLLREQSEKWLPPGAPTKSEVQRALREFANPTPPKPDEPTGLGAVVEDDKGQQWVRSGKSYRDPNWRICGGSDWTHYADIKAVRILSAGVES